MMRYHLTIDSVTENLIFRDASLLTQAAAERIHEEFYAILTPPGATRQLHFMDDHGIFTTLMPEFIPARGMLQPGLHHWDVLEHSIETVACIEQLASILSRESELIDTSRWDMHGQGDLVEIRILLQEAEQQGLIQWATISSPIMKLAALLHDIGKTVTYKIDEEENIHFYGHPQAGIPLALQIMKRINASVHDRRFVQQVLDNHMRPGQLSQDNVTPRAIRRYFVDLGPMGIYVALISLADHLAMRGPEPLTESWAKHLSTVRHMLTRYIRERQSILPPRILQPEELMQRFHLQPGPKIGQILEYISEAQSEGLIHSRTDAIWFIEDKLRDILSS
jgi:tRNA nucleotidyltransferase/poly(A) polymerase